MGVLKMYLHLWDQSGTQNGAYNSLWCPINISTCKQPGKTGWVKT
jgi:hypothetical protein